MPLLEILTLEVAPAIAKAILKVWLKDSDLALDLSSSLLDVLKTKTKDILAQEEGKSQFERIGRKVALTLQPLFEGEGGRLDEGSRDVVALAVAETIANSRIDARLLAQQNLE